MHHKTTFSATERLEFLAIMLDWHSLRFGSFLKNITHRITKHESRKWDWQPSLAKFTSPCTSPSLPKISIDDYIIYCNHIRSQAVA